MKMPAKPEIPKRPRSAKKKPTSGLDAKEARRQAVVPDVKSTTGLGTGPVANPKCALPVSIRIVVVDALYKPSINSTCRLSACTASSSARGGVA